MVSGQLFQWISQFSSGRRFRSNILSHLVWLGVIIYPCCFFGLFTVNNLIVQIFCGTMIVGLTAYNVLKYEYWQKHDPDRLHSEWFLTEKIRAEMAIQGEQPKLIEEDETIPPPPAEIEDNRDDRNE